MSNLDSLFNVQEFWESFPLLIKSIPVTMGIGVLSFIIGLFIGLVVAIIRIYKVPVLKGICKVYVSYVRGTPLVVQLFLINYGVSRIIFWLQNNTDMLADFNVAMMRAEYYGLLAFSFNLGGYLSETIRAAMESVDIGQFEAAKSIGMTTKQMMMRIVIPQAVKVAIPNLNNTMINTIKDTSLLFTIGIIDLMGRAKIYGAKTMSIIEAYIAVSLIYWVISFALEKIFARIEARSKAHDKEIN